MGSLAPLLRITSTSEALYYTITLTKSPSVESRAKDKDANTVSVEWEILGV